MTAVPSSGVPIGVVKYSIQAGDQYKWCSSNILELQQNLADLEAWLHRLHRDRLISRLQPGLSADNVREGLQSIGLPAPEDLCGLYEWHNGTNIEVGEAMDDFHMFPGFYFSPFEDAIKDYRAFTRDRRWNKTWLPFLADGGGDFYAVDCIQESASPVVGFMIDQTEQPVEYSSVRSMVRSWVEAFASGVFYVDSRGYLVADDDRYVDIAARNNPDVSLWRS